MLVYIQVERQEWKVIDAMTGLRVRNVVWADNERHAIAVCCCDVSYALGCDGEVEYTPKVVIELERRCVLINVQEAEILERANTAVEELKPVPVPVIPGEAIEATIPFMPVRRNV